MWVIYEIIYFYIISCFRTSITTTAPDGGWRIIPPRHEENAGNPDEQPEVQVPEPKVQQEPENQEPELEQVTTETVTLTTDTETTETTTLKNVEADGKISDKYTRRKQKPFVMVDPDLDDDENDTNSVLLR